MKLLIAISGASGTGYAIHFLKTISKNKKIKTELIISEYAQKILKHEENTNPNELKKYAKKTYDNNNLAEAPSSSSHLIDAMIIIPCSVKTASEIATANCNTLISRTADNILKMKKKLVICIRETPLSAPALKNLYKLSLYGATIMPLTPAFYHKPKNINDLNKFITGKALDCLGIKNEEFKRWK
jgi:polyprenyl P-hydroxybenzoate/phenylacrylic acid decarboxylase-like protein